MRCDMVFRDIFYIGQPVSHIILVIIYKMLKLAVFYLNIVFAYDII